MSERFAPAVPPSQHPGGFKGYAHEHVTTILNNSALDEMARELNGVSIPTANDDPIDRIDVLYGISDDSWNQRGALLPRLRARLAAEDQAANVPMEYRERWNTIEKADILAYDQPDSAKGRLILRAAKALEMIDDQPMTGDPVTARIVLGGAANACFQRTEHAFGYAITPLKAGEAPEARWNGRYTDLTPAEIAPRQWGSLVAVGARPMPLDAMNPKAREATLRRAASDRAAFAKILPDALKDKAVLTEADQLYTSARYLMGCMGEVVDHGSMPISDAGYASRGEPGTVRVLEGSGQTAYIYESPYPDSDRRPRADSDETLDLVLAQHPGLFKPDSTVAVVTNSIYQFQEPSFLHRITSRTGAVPRMTTFSAHTAGIERKPSTVLQETNSLLTQVYGIMHPEHYELLR